MAVSLTYDIANRVIQINSMTGELNTCEDVVRALSALNAAYATTVMSFSADDYWTGGVVGLSAELRCADNPTCNLTFLSSTYLLVDREPAGRNEVLHTLRQGSMVIQEGCLLNFNRRKQTNRNMFILAQGKIQFLGTETHRISCESPAQYRCYQFDKWSGLSAVYVDHYDWCSNSVNGRDQTIGPLGSPGFLNSVVAPTLTNENYGWALFDNCRMYPGPYWESLNGTTGANSWAGIFLTQDIHGAVIKDCYFYKPYRAFQANTSSTLYLRCTADNPREVFFHGTFSTQIKDIYNSNYNFAKCDLYKLNFNQRSVHYQDCVFKDYFLDSTNTGVTLGPGFLTGPWPHIFSNCIFDFSNSFYDTKNINLFRSSSAGFALEDAKRPSQILQGGAGNKTWFTFFGQTTGNNSGGYLQGYFTKIKVIDKNNNPIYAAKVMIEHKQNKEKDTFYTNTDGEIKSVNGQDIFLVHKEHYGKENAGTSNQFLSAFGSAYWSDGLGDQYHIITAYKEGYEPTVVKAVINDEKEFVIKLLPEGSKIKAIPQRKIDSDANTYIQTTNCKNPKKLNDFVLALKKENYWDRIKIGWIFGTEYNTSTLTDSNSTTQVPFKGSGDVVFVDSEMKDYGLYMNQNNVALSSYAEFPLLGMDSVSGVPFFINAIPLTPNPATNTSTQDFVFYNKENNVRFIDQGKGGTGGTANNLYQVYPNVGRRFTANIVGYTATNNLYTSFSWNITPPLTSCVMFNDNQQTPRLFEGRNDDGLSVGATTSPIQDVMHRFAPRNQTITTSSNGACQLNLFLVFNPNDGLKASESFRLGEILEATLYSGVAKLT